MHLLRLLAGVAVHHWQVYFVRAGEEKLSHILHDDAQHHICVLCVVSFRALTTCHLST